MTSEAALARILDSCQFTGMSRGLRDMLRDALTVELMRARRDGAHEQKRHDCGMVACKKGLYIGDKDRALYNALAALELEMRGDDA